MEWRLQAQKFHCGYEAGLPQTHLIVEVEAHCLSAVDVLGVPGDVAAGGKFRQALGIQPVRVVFEFLKIAGCSILRSPR